jgi:hypothetical protein
MDTPAQLHSYWITFAEGSHTPSSVGVTAWSFEDACHLLNAYGYYPGEPVAVREDVAVGDLDQRVVVPNIGPILERGIWYPALNAGV